MSRKATYSMKGIIEILRKSSAMSRLVPTLEPHIIRSLNGCRTVLDIGCGPKSPISNVSSFETKIGVEPYLPYLQLAQARKTHDIFINSLAGELDFPENSFDAVIMIDVIEHLEEAEALTLISRAESWAREVVVISSPNGFVPQKELDGNPLQKHLSGWPKWRMKELGYQSKGMAGPKLLRQEVQSDSMGEDIFASIRFRPRFVWFVLATVCQPIVYRIPQLAFSLLSIKRLPAK